MSRAVGVKMSSLRERYDALPRAVRWALLGGGGILAYFLVVDPVLVITQRTIQRADSKQALLTRDEAQRAEREAAAAAIAIGVSRFGRVSFPESAETRSVEFNTAVSRLLSKHGVRNQTSTSRTTAMTAGPLTQAVGPEARVERLVRDIQFEAEPEAVAALIADLEKEPVVSAVSRVQIRGPESRDRTTRAVRVTLAVECWMLTRKEAAR